MRHEGAGLNSLSPPPIASLPTVIQAHVSQKVSGQLSPEALTELFAGQPWWCLRLRTRGRPLEVKAEREANEWEWDSQRKHGILQQIECETGRRSRRT
jgi:hypothetical protein